MNRFLSSLFIFLMSCIVSIGAGHAQVIDIETFGTGPYPGPPLPAGQTNQIYNAVAQPANYPNFLADGEYVIATDSKQGFTSWASIADNTTGSGYMMLVNADDNSAGEFYRRTVTLTSNTSFDFVVFAVNVNSQGDFDFCSGTAAGYVEPNIRLQIEAPDGSVIAFSDTGDIAFDPMPTWEEHSLTFTTNASTTDVDVVLLNNSIGGCGNDLAVDDITFRVAITMEANDDAITVTDTSTQQNDVIFVGANDTLDSNALPGTELYFIEPPLVLPPELLFDTNTGAVSVLAGTPSGTYSFEYRVCETANEYNCDTATATITVDLPPAVIVAENDTGSVLDSSLGNTSVLNLLDNDTIDGAAPANFDLSLAPGETLPVGLTFDTATGEIVVLQGTPSGTLMFDYQLCEAGDPNNCEIATATINVTNPNPPSVCPIGKSLVSGTFYVITSTGGNNSFRAEGAPLPNGTPVTDNDTGITYSPDVIYDLTGDPNIIVPEGTVIELALGNRFNNSPVAGISSSLNGSSYTSLGSSTGPWPNNLLRYDQYTIPAGGARYIEIDQSSGGLRFDGAVIPSLCTPSPSVIVDAQDDSGSVADSSLGDTAVLNVLDNDTIDGVSPPAAFDLTLASPSLPAGVTFDTATGEVTVLQGTPTGILMFDYTLCEAGNNLNCETVTVTINVTNPNPPSICPVGTIPVTGTFHVISATSATQFQSLTNPNNALDTPIPNGQTASDSNSATTFNADVLYDLTGDSNILVPAGTIIDVALANFFGNNPVIDVSSSLDNMTFVSAQTVSGLPGQNVVQHSQYTVPAGGIRYILLERSNNTSFRFDGVTYDTQCSSAATPAAPDVSVVKSVAMFTPDSYAIPGNDVIYTFTVTNDGDGVVDDNTLELIDIMPSEVAFYNGAPNPVTFTDSGSGLTFDSNTDLKFSDSVSGPPTDFSDCNYTPAAGYDDAVTYICFNPKGEMNGMSEWSVSFRARID